MGPALSSDPATSARQSGEGLLPMMKTSTTIAAEADPVEAQTAMRKKTMRMTMMTMMKLVSVLSLACIAVARNDGAGPPAFPSLQQKMT